MFEIIIVDYVNGKGIFKFEQSSGKMWVLKGQDADLHWVLVNDGVGVEV